MAYRPYCTDGLNQLQTCSLLVNVFTLFVGIMLIITAELEDAAKRAGEDYDFSERNTISVIVFLANIFILALPIVQEMPDMGEYGKPCIFNTKTVTKVGIDKNLETKSTPKPTQSHSLFVNLSSSASHPPGFQTPQAPCQEPIAFLPPALEEEEEKDVHTATSPAPAAGSRLSNCFTNAVRLDGLRSAESAADTNTADDAGPKTSASSQARLGPVGLLAASEEIEEIEETARPASPISRISGSSSVSVSAPAPAPASAYTSSDCSSAGQLVAAVGSAVAGPARLQSESASDASLPVAESQAVVRGNNPPRKPPQLQMQPPPP